MKESDSNTTWSDVEDNISTWSKWTSEECIAESEEFVKEACQKLPVPNEYGFDHDFGEVVFRWGAHNDSKRYLKVIFRKDKRGPYVNSHISGSRSLEELKPGDLDFEKVSRLLLQLEHLPVVRKLCERIEQNAEELKKRRQERAKERASKILKSLETADNFGPHDFEVEDVSFDEIKYTVERLNSMGLRASIDELKRDGGLGKTSVTRKTVIRVTVVNPDMAHKDD